MTVALSYAQFAIATVTGLLVVPILITTFGSELYGMWLAGAEAIGYALLLDFGVTAVLPWLVAQSDGRGETDLIREYLLNAIWLTLITAALAAAAACLFWQQFGHADAGREARLHAPLLLLLLLMLASLPLNVFFATLQGLQEVAIYGFINLAKGVFGPVFLIFAIYSGQGLYCFPIAYLVTPIGGLIAIAYVANRIGFRRRRPNSPTSMAWLLREGTGPWLAALSMQMLARSSAVILAGAGDPRNAAIFACSYRAPQLLTQLAWTVPDGALVSLAQLAGEGTKPRVREIVSLMLRVEIVLAGFVACSVLTANEIFVRWWVGSDLFGGFALNVTLALDMVLSSIIHLLVTVAAVLGHRLAIGVSSLLQGLVFVGLSIFLVPTYGLLGLTVALLASPWATTAPTAIVILNHLDVAEPKAVGVLIMQMGVRLLPLLLVSAAFGYFRAPVATPLEGACALAILSLVYAIAMRSTLAELTALVTPLRFLRGLPIVSYMCDAARRRRGSGRWL